jgi:hypothetical protein
MRTLRFFILNTIVFLILYHVSFSQHLPDDLLQSSVLLKIGNQYGTGFYLRDSNSVYFITARHCLLNKSFKILNDLLELVSYPEEPTKSKQHVIKVYLGDAIKNNCFKYLKNKDIALIKMGWIKPLNKEFQTIEYNDFVRIGKSSKTISTPLEGLEKYDSVHIGDNIYIPGYPVTLNVTKLPQYDFSRPLLRKGIVAGKYEKQKTIIVEGTSFPGNSGGPVIVNYVQGSFEYFKIIGIVIQYIPYSKEWVKKTKGDYNSGYSVVEPIDSIYELLK